MFGDIIAGAAQACGQLRRGLRFMRREFGILVQIEIERVRVGINAFDFFGRRSSGAQATAREQYKQQEVWTKVIGPGSYLPAPAVCKRRADQQIVILLQRVPVDRDSS